MKASELNLVEQAKIVEFKELFAKIHAHIDQKRQTLDMLLERLDDAKTITEANSIRVTLDNEKEQINSLMNDLVSAREEERQFLKVLENKYNDTLEFDLF